MEMLGGLRNRAAVSLRASVGLQPCCKAVTKQLDGAVIGYTDPSVVMQSGANVRSRFKEFIDSRR